MLHKQLQPAKQCQFHHQLHRKNQNLPSKPNPKTANATNTDLKSFNINHVDKKGKCHKINIKHDFPENLVDEFQKLCQSNSKLFFYSKEDHFPCLKIEKTDGSLEDLVYDFKIRPGSKLKALPPIPVSSDVRKAYVQELKEKIIQGLLIHYNDQITCQ